MSKKILSVFLAMLLAIVPNSPAFAVTIGAEGTLGAVSNLTVAVFNTADDSANGTGLGFNGASGSTVITSPQYLKMNFEDNSIGFQSITISTDNRNASASPKYTGPAGGSGLTGVTATDVTVPLVWTVFDAKVSGGYSFQSFINSAAGEFFVSDKKQGDAALCQNDSTQAFVFVATTCDTAGHTDIDWDGSGARGAAPYDSGFATIVSGIGGTSADIADASGCVEDATNPDDDTKCTRNAIGQKTTDGEVFMYLATNYDGAAAQQYKTSTLEIELITV